MPDVTRVLVPIDFSPSARAALGYATFLAGKLGAVLTVLHVREPPGYVGPDTLVLLPVAPAWEQTRTDVMREVERFLGGAQPKPAHLDVRVEEGVPADTILHVASDGGVDLIVMGTHGRTGLSRLLVGSVAESVIRRSTCPVLTDRPGAGEGVARIRPVVAGAREAMTLVSDVMNRSVVAVALDDSVEDAERVAHRSGADHLLVFDEETLVGILCTCDLEDAERGDRVCDRMSLPVLTVRPDASVEAAAETLTDCDLGCLPVALGGLILGTLGNAELARAGVRGGHVHGRCRRRNGRRAVH